MPLLSVQEDLGLWYLTSARDAKMSIAFPQVDLLMLATCTLSPKRLGATFLVSSGSHQALEGRSALILTSFHNPSSIQRISNRGRQ